MPEDARNMHPYGSGEQEMLFSYADGMRAYEVKKPFEGVIRNLERRYLETESEWAREETRPLHDGERPATPAAASASSPRRWRSRSTTGISARFRELSVREAAGLVRGPAGKTRRQAAARSPRASCSEIGERLRFLIDVGLDYLTLARGSGTLSGGESQRIRLASQIGSGLTGVLYVLDEPSIGLHQRDNARLLETLRRLRDLGNIGHRRRA